MSSGQLQNWRDDLDYEDLYVGNVRTQVLTALDAARQHMDNRINDTGEDELDQAAEALQRAIDVLELLRTRIRQQSKEEFVAIVALMKAREVA